MPPSRPCARDGFAAVAEAVALAALSIAFRAPALAASATLHSDAAVVGLQARHVLRGELSPFLWGSGYQTSVDAIVAAGFFAVLGASAFALVLSTLLGHVALTLFAWATLRRHLGRAAAFVATLPLVFTSAPVHTYVLSPPRQAALTLVFAAAWSLDRPSPAKPDRLDRKHADDFALAAGGGLAALAVYADPYALLFVPALALLGVLVAVRAFEPAASGARAATRARLLALGVGAALGAIPVAWLWSRAEATSGPRSLSLAFAGRSAGLLVRECLPWLFGARVYRGSTLLDYGPWDAPFAVRALGAVGMIAALGAIVAGGALACGVPAPRAHSVPASPASGDAPRRRLAIAFALQLPLTLGAFLLSPMVMDPFAARYLVAIVLAMPFAIAPLAARLGAARVALVLAPALAAAGLAGAVGYPRPAPRDADHDASRAIAHDADHDASRATPHDADLALKDALLARGVHHATADYWVAYRLTFLFGEDPIVVPLHASEDRYAPFRAAVRAAPACAYLHDPARSREPPDPGVPFAIVHGVRVREIPCADVAPR